MSRTLWLYGIGLVAACALLAAPQAALAQNYHRHNHSSGVRQLPQYAPRASSFAPGNSYWYGGYNSYRPYYGGNSYYRQPVIVHPEYYHWTPGRGFHSHGHLHVPHGNHYHTRPY